jgi:hypothetical protein
MIFAAKHPIGGPYKDKKRTKATARREKLTYRPGEKLFNASGCSQFISQFVHLLQPFQLPGGRMPTLYHYSPLLHLPPICCEGLCQGEIAMHTQTVLHTAVSLTTQTDPCRLACWGGPQPTSTAIRYRCHIPDGDTKLEPARDTWKRLGVPAKYVREGLDPNGQSKWWYFYHGTIPTNRFSVELRGEAGYVLPSTPELTLVVAEVRAVRDKFHFVVPANKPWALNVVLKDKSDESPFWLLDETHPADRYLAARAN